MTELARTIHIIHSQTLESQKLFKITNVCCFKPLSFGGIRSTPTGTNTATQSGNRDTRGLRTLDEGVGGLDARGVVLPPGGKLTRDTELLRDATERTRAW